MAPKVNSNCDAMDRDPLRTVVSIFKKIVY